MRFNVKFRNADDMYYSDYFEAYDRDTLIERFNMQRFVLLPSKHDYALNLDHVVKIEIEEVKQK